MKESSSACGGASHSAPVSVAGKVAVSSSVDAAKAKPKKSSFAGVLKKVKDGK